MNLPLKVKLKVILLTLLNTHLNNNIRSEPIQMLVLGTVTNPKSTPLTGVQYVSVHCVLILVLGYITLKRTT